MCILLSNVPALVVLCVDLAARDRVLIACVVMVVSPTSGVDRNIVAETTRPSADGLSLKLEAISIWTAVA